jgi:hypothetical protein
MFEAPIHKYLYQQNGISAGHNDAIYIYIHTHTHTHKYIHTYTHENQQIHNLLFNLLVMYGGSCMFQHYIAILRERC